MNDPVGVQFNLKTQRARPGGVKYHKLPLGRAQRMSELTQDFVFFTPGILCIYGGFQDGPLGDYLAEGHDTEFFLFHSNRDLFHGLTAANGDKGWQRGLMATRTSEWQGFADYMISLVFPDRVNGVVHRIGLQEITIIDPLAMSAGGIVTDALATFPVMAFGINSSEAIYAFRTNPEDAYPTVGRFPPDESMVRYAQRVLGATQPIAMETDREANPGHPG